MRLRKIYREKTGVDFKGRMIMRWRCKPGLRAARFRSTHRPDMFAVLHPSTKQAGHWQVSYFDEAGAIGDCARPTADQAVRDSELDYGWRLERAR